MMRQLYLSLLLCAAMVVPCNMFAQNNSNNNNRNNSSSSNNNNNRNSSSSSSSSSNNNRNSSSSSSSSSTGRSLSSSGNSTASSNDRTKTRQAAAKKKADDAAKKKAAANKTAEDAKKKAAAAAKAKQGGNNSGKPASNTASSATTISPFAMKPNEATNMLSIELASAQPTLNIVAAKGEVFATRVMLRSGGMEEFDSIDVSVKYDPRVLEPQGIDDKSFASRLAEPALARVDRAKGIIAWHGRFSQPTVVNTSEVFRVAWKGIALSDKTAIAFANNGDYPSRVMKGRRNLLLPLNPEGAELGDDEMTDRLGLLGCDVTVVTDLVTDDTATGTSGTAVVTTVGSNTHKLAREIVEGKAVGNIKLNLTSSTPHPVVGKDFVVTISYANPTLVDFDRVRLTLNYDPRVLQVVDWDNGNWITQGTNIYDGNLHEELPFDMHLKNQVMNNMGRILYEMAFTHRPAPVEKGVLARIRFVPQRTAAYTRINFEFADGDTYTQSPTALTFLGYNLIGEPGKRAASYSTLNLPISNSGQ